MQIFRFYISVDDAFIVWYCVTGYLVSEFSRQSNCLEWSGTKCPGMCHIPEEQDTSCKGHEIWGNHIFELDISSITPTNALSEFIIYLYHASPTFIVSYTIFRVNLRVPYSKTPAFTQLLSMVQLLSSEHVISPWRWCKVHHNM
jgi:hypothetical protein